MREDRLLSHDSHLGSTELNDGGGISARGSGSTTTSYCVNTFSIGFSFASLNDLVCSRRKEHETTVFAAFLRVLFFSRVCDTLLPARHPGVHACREEVLGSIVVFFFAIAESGCLLLRSGLAWLALHVLLEGNGCGLDGERGFLCVGRSGQVSCYYAVGV